jgi:hypothetical protein
VTPIIRLLEANGRASAVLVTTDRRALLFPIFTCGRHGDEPIPLDAGVSRSSLHVPAEAPQYATLLLGVDEMYVSVLDSGRLHIEEDVPTGPARGNNSRLLAKGTTFSMFGRTRTMREVEFSILDGEPNDHLIDLSDKGAICRTGQPHFA